MSILRYFKVPIGNNGLNPKYSTRVKFGEWEKLVNGNFTYLMNKNSILQVVYRVDSNKTHISL